MRWDSLRLSEARAAAGPRGRADAPALFERDAVARTFDTPGSAG